MSKIKRKLTVITRRLRSISLPSLKRVFNQLPIGALLVFVLVTFVIGVNQYLQLSKVNDRLSRKGEEIQSLYHREVKLIEKLEIVDTKEFRTNCENYSLNCITLGSDIRREFLANLKSVSFKDSDIEILNMISSIDVSVKSLTDEYNKDVIEYNKVLEKYPGVFLKLIFNDRPAI